MLRKFDFLLVDWIISYLFWNWYFVLQISVMVINFFLDDNLPIVGKVIQKEINHHNYLQHKLSVSEQKGKVLAVFINCPGRYPRLWRSVGYNVIDCGSIPFPVNGVYYLAIDLEKNITISKIWINSKLIMYKNWSKMNCHIWYKL